MVGSSEGVQSISRLHTPVLLERCLEILQPAIDSSDAILLDCTLGLAGHAEAALKKFPNLKLIGIDRDPVALDFAKERLSQFQHRTQFANVTYDQLDSVLADLSVMQVDGILFDLGVSSMQLDKAERGFSYQHPGPLDMRMNPALGISAEEIVNGYSEPELIRIFREYGEEKFAARIANAIQLRRQVAPIAETVELAELVKQAIPAAARRTGGHPAKRTFQALRIAVNSELEVLTRALPKALEALKPGGRLVVMAYHSLEDRIVKQALAGVVNANFPIDLPFVPQHQTPRFKLVIKGSESANPAEVAANPRSASVRLRAIERMAA